MRVLRMSAALFAVGAATVGLSACASSPDAPVVRDTAGIVVTPGGSDVFSLREGDCLREPEVDDVADVVVVPCDDEYDLQVYYRFDQPGNDYTSDATLRAQAEAACEPAFGERIGIAYSDSVLEYRTFVPSEISWSHGDRSIFCAVYDPEGPASVPMVASAR